MLIRCVLRVAAAIPLALALANPLPPPPTLFNRGIKVRASSRSDHGIASSVFDPKQFLQGSPSPKPDSPSPSPSSALPGTHIRPAPGSCAALSRVYAEMGGTSWVNQSGWVGEFSNPSGPSMPCCDWYGVLCKGNVISTLDLSSNGLSGPLSTALFTLPGLENLNLHSNSISGPMPDSFDALPKLKSFDVSNNFVTDTIPPSLATHTSLNSLHLTANQLTGFAGFSNPNLSNIFINQNAFSGMAVSQMGALQRLVANSNQMKGPLPDFSRATNMQIFSAANNSFTGDLFDLGHLKLLERFDVRNNAIGGLSLQDISPLPHLAYFNIGGNRLSGAFPSTQAPPSLIACVVLPNDFQALPSQDTMNDTRSLASRCLHHTTPRSSGSSISSGKNIGQDHARPAKSDRGASHRRADVVPVRLAPPTTKSLPPPIVPEASKIPLPPGVQNTPIPLGAPVPTPRLSQSAESTAPSLPISAPGPPMASLYAEAANKANGDSGAGSGVRIKNASSLSFSAQASKLVYALMVICGILQFL